MGGWCGGDWHAAKTQSKQLRNPLFRVATHQLRNTVLKLILNHLMSSYGPEEYHFDPSAIFFFEKKGIFVYVILHQANKYKIYIYMYRYIFVTAFDFKPSDWPPSCALRCWRWQTGRTEGWPSHLWRAGVCDDILGGEQQKINKSKKYFDSLAFCCTQHTCLDAREGEGELAHEVVPRRFVIVLHHEANQGQFRGVDDEI